MGLFDNVRTLVIDNKEVKSIVASNGRILYDAHNYDITLSSNKQNLSLSNHETATLTATITDNNNAVPNETVLFYEGNIYANTLTTNSNGFTALYGSFTYSSDGINVDNGDRLVHNQLLDMTSDSFVISFKCKPTGSSRYAVVGHFTTNAGASNSSTNFVLRDDYIDFFGGGYNPPSGIVWGNELDVRMEITPSQQKLYINGNLVGTSTADLTSLTNGANNYMNLFSFSNEQEFTMKHLGIVANGGGVFHGYGVTNNNGVATCTYVSRSVGNFTVIAEWSEGSDTVSLVVS